MATSTRRPRAGSFQSTGSSALARRSNDNNDSLVRRPSIAEVSEAQSSPSNKVTQSFSSDAPADSSREGRVNRRPSSFSISGRKHSIGNASPSAVATSIRVIVRVRPRLSKEAAEKDGVKSAAGGKALLLTNGQDHRQFGVDMVFDSRSEQGSQAMVFDHFGKNFVEQSLQGYNVCIFAYGHTGSGKTFTMLGDAWGSPGTEVHKHKAGLLPRFLREIFQAHAQDPRFKDMHYSCEFYEVYNDQIRDLLAPNKAERKRKVHVHPKHGVRIEGSTPSLVSSAEEALGLLNFGSQMRTVSSTTMNERSSRSHAIITFNWGQEGLSLGSIADPTADRLHSTTTFVDLAGREDQGVSNNKAMQFREMCFINTSLFHLAHLITKLAEGQVDKTSLTDFRNSKLTLLLSQALIGNSRTALVATVAPLQSYFDDSVSTMSFAQSVRKIQTCAIVNNKGSGGIVAELEAEVRMLRMELEGSKTNASEKETGLVAAEALIDYYKRSYEEALSSSQEMKAARSKFSMQYGLSDPASLIQQVRSSKSDPRVMPYFTKLSDDPSLQGCCNYLVKKSTLGIGSCEQSCDIVLRGLGIAPQMCEVRQDPADGCVYVEVSSKVENGPVPRVLVNGVTVSADMPPRRLEHGDSIILGYAHAFRLVKPTRVQIAQVGTDNPGVLARSTIPKLDMASAIAEIEEESGVQFKEVYPFLQQLSSQAPESVVSSFVKALHGICPLIDEANLITREVFGGEEARFQLYTLTDPFSLLHSSVPEFAVCLLQNPQLPEILENAEALHDDIDVVPRKARHPLLHAIGLGDHMMVDGQELLHVWSLEKFLLRLNEMREIYQEGSEAGDSFSAVWQRISKNPFLNPWTEPRFGDLKLFAEDIAQVLKHFTVNPPIMSLMMSGSLGSYTGSASTGISAPSESTPLTPGGSVALGTPGGSVETPARTFISPTPEEVPKLTALGTVYAAQSTADSSKESLHGSRKVSARSRSQSSAGYISAQASARSNVRDEDMESSPKPDAALSSAGFQATLKHLIPSSPSPEGGSASVSLMGSAASERFSSAMDSVPASARSSLPSRRGSEVSGTAATVPRLQLQPSRGLREKEPEKKEEVCCPRGHKLMNVLRTHKGWFCHGCGRISSASKTEMECFRCSTCNYNLCDSCYAAEANADVQSNESVGPLDGSRPQIEPRSPKSPSTSPPATARSRPDKETQGLERGMMTPGQESAASSMFGDRPLASVKCDLDALRQRLAGIITGNQTPSASFQLPAADDDVASLGGLSQETRLADLLDRFEAMITKLDKPTPVTATALGPATLGSPTVSAAVSAAASTTTLPTASITWPIVPVLGPAAVRSVAVVSSSGGSAAMPVARVRSPSPGRPGWCPPVTVALAPASARQPSPPATHRSPRATVSRTYHSRTQSGSPTSSRGRTSIAVVRRTSPVVVQSASTRTAVRVARPGPRSSEESQREVGTASPRGSVPNSGTSSLNSSARTWNVSPLRKSVSNLGGSSASVSASGVASSPRLAFAPKAGSTSSETQSKLARSPHRAHTPVRTARLSGRAGGGHSEGAMSPTASGTSPTEERVLESAAASSAGTAVVATAAVAGAHRWPAVPV